MDESLLKQASKATDALREIKGVLEAQLANAETLPDSFLAPILALREKHLVYSVVEHAADESVRDGDTLDARLSALLAAQAAITAIFLDKEGWYLVAAVAFTALTVFSIWSLRRQRYRRAPNPAYFADDYLKNPDVVRRKVIASKLEAIRFNDALAQRRGGGFTVSLWLTVAALVVLLSWEGYTSLAHGQSAGTAQAGVGFGGSGALLTPEPGVSHRAGR